MSDALTAVFCASCALIAFAFAILTWTDNRRIERTVKRLHNLHDRTRHDEDRR